MLVTRASNARIAATMASHGSYQSFGAPRARSELGAVPRGSVPTSGSATRVEYPFVVALGVDYFQDLSRERVLRSEAVSGPAGTHRHLGVPEIRRARHVGKGRSSLSR